MIIPAVNKTATADGLFSVQQSADFPVYILYLHVALVHRRVAVEQEIGGQDTNIVAKQVQTATAGFVVDANPRQGCRLRLPEVLVAVEANLVDFKSARVILIL